VRVLVLVEAIGDMGAGLVGASVARAWANRGHQVALVPQAAAGAGLGGAVTDLLGASSGILVVTDPHPGTETSTALGEALAEACDARPDQVWVDLATSGATDAGAGLVRVLGRTGADARLAEALAAARERLGSVRLLGVVPTEQVNAELTGMRGVASLAAAAARDAGEPVPPIPELLDQDRGFATVAADLGLATPPPGAGAGGGLGLAVLALGGAIASGPGSLAEVARLGETVRRADLVVVVADALDFGSAGGEVVTAARAWAEAASLPCVAVCRSVRISSRELRTLGIEAAYGLEPADAVDEASFGALATKVASTWTWGTGNLEGRHGVVTDVE